MFVHNLAAALWAKPFGAEPLHKVSRLAQVGQRVFVPTLADVKSAEIRKSPHLLVGHIVAVVNFQRLLIRRHAAS
jgi:hypothetical protein